MKKFAGFLLVVFALGLQGCASQKELIGLGESKSFTVSGKGDWKKVFRSAIAKADGEMIENSENRLSAEVKNHRVKIVARVMSAGVVEVYGALAANDLKSFYSITDEAHEATKAVADYMGSHGFTVREKKS